MDNLLVSFEKPRLLLLRHIKRNLRFVWKHSVMSCGWNVVMINSYCLLPCWQCWYCFRSNIIDFLTTDLVLWPQDSPESPSWRVSLGSTASNTPPASTYKFPTSDRTQHASNDNSDNSSSCWHWWWNHQQVGVVPFEQKAKAAFQKCCSSTVSERKQACVTIAEMLAAVSESVWPVCMDRLPVGRLTAELFVSKYLMGCLCC